MPTPCPSDPACGVAASVPAAAGSRAAEEDSMLCVAGIRLCPRLLGCRLAVFCKAGALLALNSAVWAACGLLVLTSGTGSS